MDTIIFITSCNMWMKRSIQWDKGSHGRELRSSIWSETHGLGDDEASHRVKVSTTHMIRCRSKGRRCNQGYRLLIAQLLCQRQAKQLRMQLRMHRQARNSTENAAVNAQAGSATKHAHPPFASPFMPKHRQAKQLRMQLGMLRCAMQPSMQPQSTFPAKAEAGNAIKNTSEAAPL
eukprot:1157591-Pelagomonas_calceolata.AAC.1